MVIQRPGSPQARRVSSTSSRRISAAGASTKAKKKATDFDVFKPYGKHVFTGKLADHYLKNNGGSGKILEDPNWVKDRKLADIVAAAVLDW